MKYNDENIFFIMRLHMIEYYTAYMLIYTHITIPAQCAGQEEANLSDLSGTDNI